LLRLQQVKKKPAPKPKSKTSKTSGKPGRRAGPKAAASSGILPARAHRADAVRSTPSSAKAQREALAAARTAIDAALAKKALLPVLIDVSGRASYTDYIGIVSGRSDRQVDAIADHVHKVMQESGRRLLGREGTHGVLQAGANRRWRRDFAEMLANDGAIVNRHARCRIRQVDRSRQQQPAQNQGRQH